MGSRAGNADDENGPISTSMGDAKDGDQVEDKENICTHQEVLNRLGLRLVSPSGQEVVAKLSLKTYFGKKKKVERELKSSHRWLTMGAENGGVLKEIPNRESD